MADIRIHFAGPIANLYDVGYLSVDLYQLMAFAELLEAREDSTIERWYGEKARPFNRYAPPLEKYKQTSQIRDAKGGSLDLVVAVASLLTSVIVPLAVMYLQNQKEGNRVAPRDVFFEIAVDDARLQQILRMYADGHFDTGTPALNGLFGELRNRGYDVNVRATDIFVIHDVLSRYARRMVRTLSRP